MPTELLKCSICPKRPYFSDVSHLLTHVGSKGHLAHLHKLQVRSHGELEASQQLSQYNVWYQEHQLAELLSDRMRSKEARQRGRKVLNGRRAMSRAQSNVQPGLNPNLFSQPIEVVNLTRSNGFEDIQQQRKVRRRMMQDEMDDPDYVPRLPMLCPESVFVATSPPRNGNICYCADGSDPNHFCPVFLASQRTPDSSRLKGQIWPGMDLFDAATVEQARRRNQRKDGSVMLNMRADSVQVEPYEITYSADGVMKRKRHMDHLEDDTDLLVEETPIKKLVTKPKREPRRRRAAPPKPRASRQVKTPVGDNNQTQSVPSSSTASSGLSLLAQFVVDQQSSPLPLLPDAKHVLHTSKNKEAGLSFGRDVNTKPDPKQVPTSISKLLVDTPPTYAFVRGLDTTFQPIPWLSQDTLNLPLYDPFRDYFGGGHSPIHASKISTGKENETSLFWKQDAKARSGTEDYVTHFTNVDHLCSDFGPLSHVYAYNRTPVDGISPQRTTNLPQLLRSIH